MLETVQDVDAYFPMNIPPHSFKTRIPPTHTDLFKGHIATKAEKVFPNQSSARCDL